MDRKEYYNKKTDKDIEKHMDQITKKITSINAIKKINEKIFEKTNDSGDYGHFILKIAEDLLKKNYEKIGQLIKKGKSLNEIVFELDNKIYSNCLKKISMNKKEKKIPSINEFRRSLNENSEEFATVNFNTKKSNDQLGFQKSNLSNYQSFNGIQNTESNFNNFFTPPMINNKQKKFIEDSTNVDSKIKTNEDIMSQFLTRRQRYDSIDSDELKKRQLSEINESDELHAKFVSSDGTKIQNVKFTDNLFVDEYDDDIISKQNEEQYLQIDTQIAQLCDKEIIKTKINNLKQEYKSNFVGNNYLKMNNYSYNSIFNINPSDFLNIAKKIIEQKNIEEQKMKENVCFVENFNRNNNIKYDSIIEENVESSEINEFYEETKNKSIDHDSNDYTKVSLRVNSNIKKNNCSYLINLNEYIYNIKKIKITSNNFPELSKIKKSYTFSINDVQITASSLGMSGKGIISELKDVFNEFNKETNYEIILNKTSDNHIQIKEMNNLSLNIKIINNDILSLLGFTNKEYKNSSEYISENSFKDESIFLYEIYFNEIFPNDPIARIGSNGMVITNEICFNTKIDIVKDINVYLKCDEINIQDLEKNLTHSYTINFYLENIF